MSNVTVSFDSPLRVFMLVIFKRLIVMQIFTYASKLKLTFASKLRLTYGAHKLRINSLRHAIHRAIFIDVMLILYSVNHGSIDATDHRICVRSLK